MKNWWKRALAVLMTLTMVLALFPVNAWAVESDEDTVIVSDTEKTEPQEMDVQENEPVVYADEAENEDIIVYETEEEAVAAMREQFKQRANPVTVRLRTVDSGPLYRMLLDVYAHTGSPIEGDYIRYHLGGITYRSEPDYKLGVTDFIYYNIIYYDTLEEEQELDRQIETVLKSLNLEEKSDYDKVCAIYDYICSYVEYDYDGLYDDDNFSKYSAYAALVCGRAVCQGYANLFYRMALAAGLDSRIITGTSYGEGHAWNIVKLNGKYYNVDCTWDTGNSPDNYYNFLESESDFGNNHTRDKEYLKTEFITQYPTAEDSYIAVEEIDIDPRALQLSEENSQMLSVTVVPLDATNPQVTFSSSAPTIATVDANGKVTAIKEGKATITATTEVGGLTATCTVEVQHKHTPDYHAIQVATCVAEGVKDYWSCAGCDQLFSNAECTVPTTKAELEIAIDLTNHAGPLEQRDAKDATCQEEGHEADTYCAACKALVSKGTTIAKIAHDLTKHDAQRGTYTTAGSIAYWECKVCGDIFSDAQGTVKTDLDKVKTDKDTTNHAGVQEVRNVKQATCAAEGYTGDTYCLGCQTKIADGKKTDKLAHTLIAHDAKQATCVEEGNDAYWECTTCGELFSDEQGTVSTTLKAVTKDMDPENHASGTEVKNAKSATCATSGYSGDEVCKGCDKVLVPGTEIAKSAHQLTHIDAKAASCKEKGNIEYWKCTTCNGLFSDGNGTTPVTEDALPTPVDKDNHTGSTKIVDERAATCTETGHTGDVVCADCGAVLTKGTATDKTAHQLTHVEAKTATCKEDGNIEYWKCESCGGLFSDGDGKNEVKAIMTVNKSNHIGGTELRDVKAPSCTAEGYTGDSYCLSCDKMIAEGTAVPKTAHELTKHEAVAATHSAAGSIAYWSCAACNGLFSDVAGKQPVTAQETVIPATEQKADTEHWAFDSAQHWNVCTDCGAQMNVAAHTFGDWTTQKEATTTETGVKARACTTCGYREQAEIPTLTTAETVKPSASQKPENQTKAENQKSPRTADNSNVVIGMTALALAAAGVLVTALIRKKRMK